MREPEGKKRLRLAFGLALVLHAAGLGAATRLPSATGSAGSDFEGIRVFDAAAPAMVSSVELVEWPAPRPVGEVIELATPAPVQVKRERPVEKPAEEARVATRPSPPPAVKAREPERGQGRQWVEPVAVAAVEEAREAGGEEAESAVGGDGLAAGGGGGGGFVDLGSPSERGTVAGGVSGGTPMGEVGGEGAGAGTGVGPGSGGGTGGGSGGGVGSGVGSGEGPGVGEGSGGGGEVGFRSRVAERREPEVVWKGSLEYPASAARDGAEGTVRLRVLVSEKGEVLEVEVVESSGDRRLDRAAGAFVRGWRYLPAVQDGEPRRVETHATVGFELR